ncbi:MAG TPA: hypothetical protein VFZ83_06085 [Acidimicrobiia bacterium]|nr:hypothetical protein [Acidimicrobiia bacterium]
MRRTPSLRFVTVLVAAAATLALGACGDDSDDDPGDAADPTTTVDVDTSPDTTGANGDAVTVAAGETDLGTVLVDGEGFTLYILTEDGPNESTCATGCIEAWPAVAVDGDVVVGDGLDAAQFGTIERDDGTTQLTVDEQPLYRYAPDAAPGDTNGQGIADVWFVVDPTGAPIS